MINFLPPQQKKELLEEEKLKIVMILGLVFLVSLVSLALVLVIVKNFVSAELEVENIYLADREKALKSESYQYLGEEIKKYNSDFSKLKSFYNSQNHFTEIIDKISKTIPDGVFLTALNSDLTSKKVSLSGYGSSREILLKFKENLEKEGSFQEVYFPPSTWIESANIKFMVNFFLK